MKNEGILDLILTFVVILQRQGKADVWKSTTCSAPMRKTLAVKNRPGFIDLDQLENSQTVFFQPEQTSLAELKCFITDAASSCRPQSGL